ncbi:MAG: ATP synthase F0 subunit C [Acidobacteria bacterium]|nr:ATP synthase F0 subunit C [Acidobacteriota bacterium]
MTKKSLLLLAVLFLLATPIFAADGSGSAISQPVAAVLGMAFASGLCGLAQGKAVAGAAEAMARNPGAAAGIRFALILGLALIESLALYTLVITFTTK